MLAALADGASLVHGPLRSRDTDLMRTALGVLGVAVEDVAGGWLVHGRPQPLAAPGAAVDVGNAGTVARFLPPVAALALGSVRFDGDPPIRRRPLGPLLTALAALGARLEPAGATALPVTVIGTGRLRGGPVRVDGSTSSQTVSGLLLAAPRFDTGIQITLTGEHPPSRPHLRMTTAMLRAAGAAVDDSEPGRWVVEPGPLRIGRFDVEPDLSTAAPFLAAAVATAGRVSVPDWPVGSTQPGAALPDLLSAMNAKVDLDDDNALTVTGSPTVSGLQADLRDVGELAPILAALAALADSPSRFTGIAHLRGHETDRLAALADMLNLVGADARQTPDGLLIRPGPLTGAVIETHDDHRIAMAAAVLGLVVPGVAIRNVATTAKTMPNFVEAWRSMLGGAPD